MFMQFSSVINDACTSDSVAYFVPCFMHCGKPPNLLWQSTLTWSCHHNLLLLAGSNIDVYIATVVYLGSQLLPHQNCKHFLAKPPTKQTSGAKPQNCLANDLETLLNLGPSLDILGGCSLTTLPFPLVEIGTEVRKTCSEISHAWVPIVYTNTNRVF